MKANIFKYLTSFHSKYRRLSLFLLLSALTFFSLVIYEIRTSRFQALYFSQVGKDLTFRLKPGASNSIRFPKYGPHDIRLGYTRLPLIIKNFLKSGFFIEAQAEISERLQKLVDFGIFSIYREKMQAGLKIMDRNGNLMYSVQRPHRIYKSYHEIPEIVVKTILFIENREILDPRYPYKNPAVEWDRLGKAVLEKVIQIFIPSHSAPGGSTIATQLEKYLHGDEGRTRNVKDKFQQMLSATYRAYLEGELTFGVRQRIVLDYINSIPLSALPGYGEVIGLNDGLMAWYEDDVEQINLLLGQFKRERVKADPAKYAAAFKKVLSLFIAHRRPSYFLLEDAKHLNALTNEYLHIFAAHDIISKELRDAALQVKLELNKKLARSGTTVSFIERKATNAIRRELLQFMRYRHLYDLDHVDVTVRSTLDDSVNQAVTEVLSSLTDSETVKKFGLTGDRTLGQGDPKKVIYSVSLYEKVGNVNLLRVQSDNLNRPFDINEGTKLDLGSTAKLRVLANYLGLIGDIYEEYFGKSKAQLGKLLRLKMDPLTAFVVAELHRDPSMALKELLAKAMLRRYSASPAESFFTGGGVHTFSNFNRDDNSRVVTVQEALRHSINLPFIRLMRDCLNYYKAQLSDDDAAAGVNSETKRTKYLKKFADKEGSYFLRSFYQNYRSKTSSEIVSTLVKRLKPTAKRLAVVFRYVKPQAPLADFRAFVEEHLPRANLSESAAKSLYDAYGPGKFDLNDQGYLAGLHPLELWLVAYMVRHPDAPFSEIVEASEIERQQVYSWLMKKSKRRAQDVRIRSLIEAEAFVEMHKDWKRLGFPFQSMVPSLASAIGNSGDRPAALAELMGIIVNDGMRYPTARMDRLQFAKKTPFETILALNKSAEGERVMRTDTARVLRAALQDVVENGTARRVNKAFLDSAGKVIPIGGKTGTGDNRYETFGKGGNLISSRVVNRTATFVFYLGDRFFGTVTAHVQGQDAAKYNFTSALAAELLKGLAASLQPLVGGAVSEREPVEAASS